MVLVTQKSEGCQIVFKIGRPTTLHCFCQARMSVNSILNFYGCIVSHPVLSLSLPPKPPVQGASRTESEMYAYGKSVHSTHTTSLRVLWVVARQSPPPLPKLFQITYRFATFVGRVAGSQTTSVRTSSTSPTTTAGPMLSQYLWYWQQPRIAIYYQSGVLDSDSDCWRLDCDYRNGKTEEITATRGSAVQDATLNLIVKCYPRYQRCWVGLGGDEMKDSSLSYFYFSYSHTPTPPIHKPQTNKCVAEDVCDLNKLLSSPPTHITLKPACHQIKKNEIKLKILIECRKIPDFVHLYITIFYDQNTKIIQQKL